MQTLYSKLSGVTRQNPDGSDRQEIIEALCYNGQPLLLLREPNQFSENNIGVYLAFQIGYVSPELADELAPLIDEGIPIEAQITEITGGAEGKPTRGVNVAFTIFE
ncbi:MAG: hypothetical protein FJ010_06525 [Chloroflexi bacterium]|nr:hypothetical protein [Chloroflexota bacterium]